MEKHSFEDLDNLYQDGEKADYALFSEMRSNCLLHSSNHYMKITDKLTRKLEETRTAEALKLRLTKNHLQVITKTYMNGIVSESPGVKITAFNKKILADQKEAELSQAVWNAAEKGQNLEEKTDDWAQDFVVIGECHAIVRWNPQGGKFKGMAQAQDESGSLLFKDQQGQVTTEQTDMLGQPNQPMASERAIFTGSLDIEPIYGFNLIREDGAESLEGSRWLCLRKMVTTKDLKALVSQLPPDEAKEKMGYIEESANTTFKVFDPQSGEYVDSKDQILLREFYFRPCAEYRDGYFYICTDNGILFEGPLPFGIFPIITSGFDKIPTSPRYRSIIKALRGPQAEINRMASMISTTQVTLGDDKVITLAGSKLSKGSQWAGIREFSVAGQAPVILEGKSGSQFEASLAREVNEIYRLANLEFEMADRPANTDPYAMLYQNLSQKKKYSLYVRKFQRFQVKVAETYLRLAKRYLPDDELIKAVSAREYINLPEFKNIKDDGFNITVKPMSKDIDSMMGMQLNINQTLQYLGANLPKEVQGRLLRMMPFINQEQVFDYLTIDDENIDADILALDRGEMRPAKPVDNHQLYIQRLNHRTKQNDFELLNPQIKQMYQVVIDQHIQMKAMDEQQLLQAQSGFIPASGALVKVDFYGEDGKRITLPYESISWLVDRLEKQGQSQTQLAMLSTQNQTDVMNAALAGQSQQMQLPVQQDLNNPMMGFQQ